MYRYMIKIVIFFPLLFSYWFLKQNNYSIEKALYSYCYILIHISKCNVPCNFFFFLQLHLYTCTCNALSFFSSSSDKNENALLANQCHIYMYSLFQGTENLKILFVATHSNFEVNNICQKNEQYCITECMPLHFFKPNTLNGDFKHQICSTLLQTATLNNMYMNISRFSG